MAQGASNSTAHVPARIAPMDGLRGWGTCFVLVGHMGLSRFWPHLAGVLAVSMFFTLSGFLIGTALLRQLHGQGIRWGHFYAGRARRLLPAATVTVAGVAIVWRVTGRSLPTGDVVSSLLYVRNWQLLGEGSDYGAVFNDASPLTHYWSLSIEEQFYLLLPALLAVLVWAGRRSTRLVVPTLALLSVAAFVWSAVRDQTDGRTAAYYDTGSRAGEFLIGVLLAALLASPRTRAAVDRVSARRWTPAAMTAAVVVSLVAWQRVGFETPYLFSGLTAANTVMVALMLAFFTAPSARGLGVRFLSFAPLTALGRRSYSVYLVHWPIYLFVDRPGPATLTDSLTKLLLALVIGVALYELVEEPVYRSRRLAGARHLWAGLATASLVAVALTATAVQQTPLVDVDQINTSTDDFFEDLPTITPDTTPTVAPPSTTAASPDTASPDTASPDTASPDTASPDTASPDTMVPFLARDVERVMVVGDSNAFTSTLWMRDNREDLAWDWRLWAGTGCGTTSGSSRIWTLDGVIEPDDPARACPTWVADLGDAVAAYDPDVVLVVSTGADLAAHDLGDGIWRGLGDPIYDAQLRAHQERFLDLLTATGAVVGWMDSAGYRVVDPTTGVVGTGEQFLINDDASSELLNTMLHDLARRRPADVQIVPFTEWADSWPQGRFDTDWRPDGAHIDGTRVETADWMVAQVEAVARGDHLTSAL
jgi:peptidoglycan/LPS O-acetylase OafA/YrhL